MLQRRDLYGVLQIPRTATPEEIKSAYRAAVKVAHPDAGGSAIEFDCIQRAYDCLIDPERRAKYDATGDTSERQADNATGEIWAVVSMAIDQAIQAVVSAGQDPVHVDLENSLRAAALQLIGMLVESFLDSQAPVETTDVMAGMRKELERVGQEAAVEMAKVTAKIARAEKAAARFATTDPVNAIDRIIEFRVKRLQAHKVKLEQALEQQAEALKIIAAYSFDHTDPYVATMRQMPMQQSAMGMFGS